MVSGTPVDLQSARDWLEGRLSPRRTLHSEGVLSSVSRLAAENDVDAAPLQLAALLHDCARELPGGELLSLAREWGLPVRDVDRRSPVLLHGRVGLELATRELGPVGPVTASAVIYHTAGHPLMSLSDKIFFLCDHIEPGRDFARIEELRRAAHEDIDAAMRFAIEVNLEYLRAAGKTVDPDTLALRDKLEQD